MLFLILFIVIVFIFISIYYLQYLFSGYKKAGGHSFKEVFWCRLINSNKSIGCQGEYYTYLELLKFKFGGARILTNLYIVNKDNESTEIDIVMIHKTGIYIFESKNFSGGIYGNYKDKYWTQALGYYHNCFYNPILQNEKHIKYIDDLFNGRFKNNIYSFVVFSDRCRLKKVKYSGDVRVVRRSNLVRNIRKRIVNTTNLLSKDDLMTIYNELRKYINASDTVKEQHLKRFNNEQDYLRKIDLKMGKLEYEMYQDIPKIELGLSNIIFNKTYEEFLEIMKYYISCEDNIDQKLNTCTTRYIYYVKEVPIGEVAIRTTVNDYFEEKGSRIFFRVRLSERNKGYGTKILFFALIECKRMGFRTVYLNCDDKNVAAKKIIIKNNGRFLYNYGCGSRYQIDLN